jgi:hypothetical protein
VAYWLKSDPPLGPASLCASLDDAKVKLKRMVNIREIDPDNNAKVTWLLPEMRAEVNSRKYGVEVFSVVFEGPDEDFDR